MTQSRVVYFRGTSCIHPQGRTAAITKCHSEEWNLKLLLTNARNQNKLGDLCLPGCCHVEWEIVSDISGEHSAYVFSANQSTPHHWSAWSQRWRHYDPLKHKKLSTNWQHVTFSITRLWETQMSQNTLTHLHNVLQSIPSQHWWWNHHKSE